ncbi:MAG: NADPH:quinone oxidoreductase family protein [Alphaproteobacteria bacterium]|nr:NADPH:quinone oxidoreductase family protein [Alphaproteobacteria bacterium]
MRAVVCKEFAPIEALTVEYVPNPEPGAGQVLIRVAATGLNFADLLLVQGKYQEKPPRPFTPGMEIGGTIQKLGAGVEGLRVGQRVMAILDVGGFAEAAVAAASDVFPIPDGMDFATAAGFGVAYGTAHLGLDRRAGLKAGETLLVHGAAGGVGLAGVEIGKLMGATVIATAGGADKLAVAKAHGADHCIDYAKDNVRDRLREITKGAGVDVVLDMVGGDMFDVSLRSIAWEGRLVIVGFAAGRIPEAPAGLLLVKNASAIGLYWGAYRKRNPKVVRASFETLLAWHTAGKLKPHISHTLPLDQTVKAFQLLAERKATGKVVVTTGL